MTTTLHKDGLGEEAGDCGVWIEEKPGEPLWHDTAPKRIAKRCRAGEDGDGWEDWVCHLKNRGNPRLLEGLLPCRETPLLWCMPVSLLPETGRKEMLAYANSIKVRVSSNTLACLEAWVSQHHEDRPPLEHVLTALTIAHALPRLAGEISSNLWWSLLARLVSLADDAAALAVDHERPGIESLTAQLLAGELPLTLAYLFPEVQRCRHMRKHAANALSAGLVELCDGEGVLPYSLVDVHRPLAACWIRCLAMATAMKRRCWSEDAQTQFEWHVRQFIRLSRADGSPLLGGAAIEMWSPGMFETMLHLAGDSSDAVAAKSLPDKVGSKAAASTDRSPPDPSMNSEWASLTVLRTGWQRGAPRIAVGYEQSRMSLELENRRQTIFCGEWEIDVRVTGRQRQPKGEWEEVCWYSDDEVDYFELSIDLVGGGSVERQILLARQGGFLLLADNVVAERGTGITYHGRLPLCNSVTLKGEQETRDGFLIGGDQLAVVMPLALPEWRCDQNIGELTEEDGALVLAQESSGQNMNCPLFFDLKPRRMTREKTWRQLTIAESLEIQPPDVAAGYRVQCGKQQWVIYRSLASCGNRTLLGHNVSSEFYVGRFLPEGSCEELIEIESVDE